MIEGIVNFIKSRNMKTKFFISILLVIFFLNGSANNGRSESNKDKKPNILFIVVDDLKPVLGCYGDKNVKTPSIDALANQGILFDNAYCQQAVCAPSRISCFTGMRPDRTLVVDLKTNMRDKNPDIVTMPQFFKQNGYETVGLGKLMHGAKDNDPVSWSIPYKKKSELDYAEGYAYPANGKYQNPEAIKAYNEAKSKKLTWKQVNTYLKEKGLLPAVENKDVPDNAYPDGAVATSANKLLEKLSKSDKPFFMALGFNKPHLPFAAPKKYWDMYNRNSIEVNPNQEKAKYSPELAYHTWGELRNYSDIPAKGDLSIEKQKELIHGYWASTSYADAQVGKVMSKLKELNIDDNTIVVLWGDHGWHLGDHGLWCKHSNFEQATKVPFIISAPGFETGARAATMTEMVDIFPTLAEYAGLAIPKKLEGESLIPVLKKPKTKIKDYAISQFHRGDNVMGYSLRTQRFRLTLWLKGEHKKQSIVDNPVILSAELYDYKKDPFETESLAGKAEYKETLAKLRAKLLTLLQEQANNNKVVYSANEKPKKDKKEKSKGLGSASFTIDGIFSRELNSSWNTKAANGADVIYKIEKNGTQNALKVNVKNLGKNPWDIQILSKKHGEIVAGSKVKLTIKGKGGMVKLILQPTEGKQVIRKLDLGNEVKVNSAILPVNITSNYQLKILFLNKGEYLINEIKVSGINKTKTEGANNINPVKGSVRLDNKNIHVLGANYVTRKVHELSFSRFSDKAYSASNEERMFNVDNGRTISGVKLQFKTNSGKIKLTFNASEGKNRGSEFLVLQDGEVFNTYAFKGEQSKKPMHLEFLNKKGKESTLFEIVMPIFSNVVLTQLILDETAKLEVFQPEKKPVYLAIGNSITHGVGQGSASYLTYPYILANKLNCNYYNLAIGGAKISQAVAIQTAEMPQAEIITILIGYNDLVGFGKTPEQYIKDYRKFLTTIRKNQPKATIYCISITYTNTVKSKKTEYTPNDFRTALKELINEFIAAGDPNLVFVAGDKISSVDNLREDNPKDPVHFGIKGAELFANELYDIIVKQQGSITTPVLKNNKTIRKVLEEKYLGQNIFVGATTGLKAKDSIERRILAEEFSYITPANDFKQTAVHPKPDVWNWEKSDAWIKFAKKHNQVIRIHGPISPQCSRWVKNDDRTAEELEKILIEYMTALCKRYNKEEGVIWMDVINETVNRDGSWKAAKPGDKGWEMPWEKMGYSTEVDPKYKNLGGKVPLYIIKAFEIASKYATNKKLVINQHAGMETAMWAKVKDLVLFLRDQGYRVDGIGWQAHISTTRDNHWETPEVSLKNLKELIGWAHNNQLEFHITEFNIHVPHSEIYDVEYHKKLTVQIFNVLFEMRKTGLVTWNLWTIHDQIHYKNKKKFMIGLWDENYVPKQNYFKIKELLENPSAKQ